MNTLQIPHPPITTEAEWLAARKAQLELEKEATKHKDRVNAARRRMPMVKVEKEYVLEGPDGMIRLADLFDGRPQLIIHHVMYDPADERACPGCTGHINAYGDLSGLGDRKTSFAIVSRAPISKLLAYKAAQGWTLPWYSSFDSDFNYDFHVTLDPAKGSTEYNYKDQGEKKGEWPGMSVFFRVGDDIYHTNSVYARGLEPLTDSYQLLDLTPYGRQEDFEDSPEGWPQSPTYG